MALEVDAATADDGAGLDDTELVDEIVALEHLASWVAARQARLTAAFVRRRPGDDRVLIGSDVPSTMSAYAPDEIALALSQSRFTAKARIGQAVQLTEVLTDTLTAWETGRMDGAKVRAICDATHRLPVEVAVSIQDRVLPMAPRQSLGQLKEALKRAVIAADPDGAAERHKAARTERRVCVGAENDGMASIWALLPADVAVASHQWLSRLARGLGKADPRGMDARRADLMGALLTGNLTVTAGTPGAATVPGAPAPAPAPGPAPGPATGSAATGSGPTGSGPRSGGATDTDETDTAETDSDATGGATTGGTTTGGATTGGATTGGAATGGAATGGAATGGAATGGAATGGEPPGESAPAGMVVGGMVLRPVSPGKPLVQVVMPYSTLRGLDDQPCELVGYGPIPADLAREIAADAVWRRLVTDPLSGAVLDHGRDTYRPPAALTDFVKARDVYCRFPVCRRRAQDSELDHTIPYPDGPTADYNLPTAASTTTTSNTTPDGP